MIRIKEEKIGSAQSERVFLVTDNHNEILFDSYPVVIKPTHMKHLIFKASILEKKTK
ncbi:hypothetical protein [Candidatus Nitrosocosmicus arcticus]|uniref:Uncharacterized protein n=1 Tax=Candidatus Nitrosocosmicus arcticus TaxID=2035267 RepID=A0A557SSF5_9ARCH|nr:hypothetical protein [Candidatus Nitrosocosmicus arcticus]TVP39547.1 hypothetical protein NARC_140002 [Candidatus Nitrosocosmicus arcticus]